jgi:hypothetical protein
MLDAGRLLTAGELGLDRKLGRGTSKQETLTIFLGKGSQLFSKGNLYLKFKTFFVASKEN